MIPKNQKIYNARWWRKGRLLRPTYGTTLAAVKKNNFQRNILWKQGIYAKKKKKKKNEIGRIGLIMSVVVFIKETL